MRKTNLFYKTSSTEEKDQIHFYTFSNYAEALTGNFLATDYKLFPSKFLCLKIVDPSDTTKTISEIKQDLLNVLIGHYENRLSVIRENNSIVDPEHTLEEDKHHHMNESPLYSLFRVLSDWAGTDESGKQLAWGDITYVGDITEENYNGIYADTICVISDKLKQGTILTGYGDQNISYETINYADYINKLCGWYNELDNLSFPSPVFDSTNVYKNVNCWIDPETKEERGIEVTEYSGSASLEFNVIIPLFDLKYTQHHLNTTLLLEELNIIGDDTTNVPLGIWFADDMISLKYDQETGFRTNWSLVISSQFKPFPYSGYMPQEQTKGQEANAWKTFAQLMIKQNGVLDAVLNMQKTINGLDDRISTLETRINEIGTRENIDKLTVDLANISIETKRTYNSLNEAIDNVTQEFKSFYSVVSQNEKHINNLEQRVTILEEKN